MSTWRDQYLAALQGRDKVESANLGLYDYCTKLADEKAELQKTAAAQAPSEEDEAPTSPQPSSLIGMGMRRVTSPAARPESPTVAQIRQDLAKAQQERGDLQSRLDAVQRELETLKSKAKVDNKRMR